MFSKLVTRSGSARALRSALLPRSLSTTAVQANVPAVQQEEGSSLEKQRQVVAQYQKQMQAWEKANALYNSEERDYENFPVVEMRDQTPGYRMYCMPYPWFDAFYKHTGVTGPYLLFGGAIMVAIDTEFMPITEKISMYGGCAVLLWHLWNHSPRVSPRGIRKDVVPALLAANKMHFFTEFQDARNSDVNAKKNIISSLEEKNEGEKNVHGIWESLKDNIDLQLEEEYRRRLFQVHQAVKKRLDFQLAMRNAKEQFERNHVVNYVVDSVRESISEKQEREMLEKCFVDLKQMAANQAK